MKHSPDDPQMGALRRSRRWWTLGGVVAGVLLSVAAGEVVVQVYLPMVRYGTAPKVRETSLSPCRPNMLIERAGLCRDPRADTGLEFSEEEIRDAGEPTLRAWWVPPASGPTDKALIFIHGAGNDRRDGLRTLQTVHAAGWGMLMVDLRNHGTSDNDGQGVTYGVLERFDVLRAARFVREKKGAERVVTFGLSMGGGTVMMAAARDEQRLIDGVIAECPIGSLADVLVHQSAVRHLPSSLGLRVMEEMRSTMGHATLALTPVGVAAAIAPRPFLVIVNGADTFIPPWHSELIFAEAREPKTRLDIPEAGHAVGFNTEPGRYAQALVHFLDGVKRLPDL